MDKIVVGEIVVSSLIRLALCLSDYGKSIADRVEVSTLLNSWKRVTEGVALYKEGIDPYMGTVFHETPVTLVVCDFFITHTSQYISLLFISCDILTSLFLYKIAQLYMKEVMSEQELKVFQLFGRPNYPSLKRLFISGHDARVIPYYVMAAFLFNPFVILNCAGFTTTSFGNLALSAVFLGMLLGSRPLSCLALSFAVLQSFYPITLIVPVCIYISKRESNLWLSISKTLLTFIFFLSSLLYISYYIVGNWSFINAIYGSILVVTDLRPNIGLFWYFFTEMFEHFRSLFIFSFQLNAIILYLPPLSLRFHSNPMLLAMSLMAIMSIFKSYPSLGDVGFYTSFLPLWKHLYSNMQQPFVIVYALIITSVLGPTVWHLWIYSRSANANFYFGVTLAFATAQIFLITDILFAYIRREFTLKKGGVEEESSDVKLLLQ